MVESSISRSGQASRTAMMAAGARGWHLYRHGPRAMFADWLGWPLVGPEMEPLFRTMQALFGDAAVPTSDFVAARSRIAEDWLRSSGAEQYVLLGAGLDSFAWRAADGIRVFEVDHPASQQWKRDRLEAMGLEAPACLTWVPIDFEKDSIRERLEQAGLDPGGTTFVSWLGVTPYLTTEAIAATFAQLGSATVAVTYAPPESEWDQATKQVSEIFLPLAAASGESIISLLTYDEFARVLADAGFEIVEEVRPSDVEARYGIPAVANVGERVVLARPV